MTVLTIQKELTTIPKILKKRIKFETEAVTMDNPNEMKYSIVDDFNTDTGTHTNTEIYSGRLYATVTDGNWVSDTYTAESDATIAELRVKGDQLAPGMIYYVSTNNGVYFQEISGLNTPITLTPPGKYIKVKIRFNSSTTPQIDSYSLLYK
jgi:hypothetical protein